MTTLQQWGLYHKTDKATHHKFCDFYEQRIGEPRTILEFGVLNGASLKMWRDRYPHATVIGFDIEDKPAILGVGVYKNDCTADNNFICRFVEYDLIIDDASHKTVDQIKAFELWWPNVNKGGHYIIEDTHTMYFDEYNPTGENIYKWAKDLGIKHECYVRDENTPNDSATIIFYK